MHAIGSLQEAQVPGDRRVGVGFYVADKIRAEVEVAMVLQAVSGSRPSMDDTRRHKKRRAIDRQTEWS